MREIAFVDGKFLQVAEATTSIDDRGYVFGDGVYEALMAFGGVPFALQEHLVRLDRSCRELSIVCPYTHAQITDIVHEALAQVEGESLLVYFQVTRGVSPRAHPFPPAGTRGVFMLTVRPYGYDIHGYEVGDDAILYEDIRWHRCDVKSLNLIPNVLALQKAVEQGCTQAIFHRGEFVTECGSANMYIVQQGRIVTHPLTNDVLPGITRAHLLEMAATQGIPVEERCFTVAELFAADEAFSSSVGRRPTPVIRVDGRPIAEGKPGPITRALQAAYWARIESDCGYRRA